MEARIIVRDGDTVITDHVLSEEDWMTYYAHHPIRLKDGRVWIGYKFEFVFSREDK